MKKWLFSIDTNSHALNANQTMHTYINLGFSSIKTIVSLFNKGNLFTNKHFNHFLSVFSIPSSTFSLAIEPLNHVHRLQLCVSFTTFCATDFVFMCAFKINYFNWKLLTGGKLLVYVYLCVPYSVCTVSNFLKSFFYDFFFCFFSECVFQYTNKFLIYHHCQLGSSHSKMWLHGYKFCQKNFCLFVCLLSLDWVWIPFGKLHICHK